MQFSRRGILACSAWRVLRRTKTPSYAKVALSHWRMRFRPGELHAGSRGLEELGAITDRSHGVGLFRENRVTQRWRVSARHAESRIIPQHLPRRSVILNSGPVRRIRRAAIPLHAAHPLARKVPALSSGASRDGGSVDSSPVPDRSRVSDFPQSFPLTRKTDTAAENSRQSELPAFENHGGSHSAKTFFFS